MQVEDDAATSTSQQQAQLLQESHTSITAALEQVAAHGELPFQAVSDCSPVTTFSCFLTDLS